MAIPGLTAVVLTWNEAVNVGRCLASIEGLCPVVVVDSGSTDETVAVCTAAGATVVHHPYSNHAGQWQWALDNLPLAADWVLALDADFVVTPALRQRLGDQLASVPGDVAGIYVRHLYRFGGATIRFGGHKRSWLRIVRRGRARADLSDLVDFRFLVDGRTIVWREGVVEDNVHDEDISTWTSKQDKFSLRLAVEEELRRSSLLAWEGRSSPFGNSDERTMWLRDRWLRMPLFLRPVLYFLYRYVLRGGFLDGRGGFLYHFLQGLWLRLSVDWKTMQLRRLSLTPGQLLAVRDAMLRTRSGSVAQLMAQLPAAEVPLAEVPSRIAERSSGA